MTMQTIQTTRKRDDSLMYEEDKDSVILRLRVELVQERAKRKELALVERDWSRERARTEHALERALVDERVHGLELEASRVKLERELVRLREEKESWGREKVKERLAMEQLAEKCERAKRREEKVVRSLREEIEEMKELLEKERDENGKLLRCEGGLLLVTDISNKGTKYHERLR